jgi:lipid II:glycine glycyltransferase (peptidoglycan interpeptide bridge formation enzyme)
MKIENISNQDQWDNWLKSNSQHNPFTQSWAWGDILLAEGKKVERLAVVEGEKVLAQAQVIYSQIIFGWQYAFCPQGPIVVSSIKYQVSSIYEEFKQYFKSKKCVFFRIEPDALNTKYLILNTKKTIDINPPATLILDLKNSEEELLAGMHQKTRYNIHLAEKKDLQISNEKNLEVFWLLMNKTGSRDKFGLHHKSHYEKVLQSAVVYQLTAYENKIPVACAVFARFGNTFTYLYGASDYEHRDLMAPYLLQWQGIKMGKSSGCQQYDFFGVAPVKDGSYDQKHQYAGVTRFKLGFGGAPNRSVGTWDMVIDNKKYKLYNLLRRLRRLI